MKNSSKASLKLKKRWFLLTHNSLDYYKSSERNSLKLGTLVLNSLCSVVQPDEKVFKETGERQNADSALFLWAPPSTTAALLQVTGTSSCTDANTRTASTVSC